MSEGPGPIVIRGDAREVAVFIDGLHLQVEAHMTILEAAEANGISIPTLCHDPRLAPAGALRSVRGGDGRRGTGAGLRDPGERRPGGHDAQPARSRRPAGRA